MLLTKDGDAVVVGSVLCVYVCAVWLQTLMSVVNNLVCVVSTALVVTLTDHIAVVVTLASTSARQAPALVSLSLSLCLSLSVSVCCQHFFCFLFPIHQRSTMFGSDGLDTRFLCHVLSLANSVAVLVYKLYTFTFSWMLPIDLSVFPYFECCPRVNAFYSMVMSCHSLIVYSSYYSRDVGRSVGYEVT